MADNVRPDLHPVQGERSQTIAQDFTPEDWQEWIERKLKRTSLRLGSEIAASLHRQMATTGVKAVASDFDVVTNTVRNWAEKPDTFDAVRLPLLALNDTDPEAILRIADCLIDAARHMARYRKQTGGHAYAFKNPRLVFDESQP